MMKPEYEARFVLRSAEDHLLRAVALKPGSERVAEIRTLITESRWALRSGRWTTALGLARKALTK